MDAVDVLTKRVQVDILKKFELELNDMIIDYRKSGSARVPGLITARNKVGVWIKNLEG